MKQFKTVLGFELTNYFKTKSYVLSTILLTALVAVIMFLPRFIDMSGFLGIETDKSVVSEENQSEENKSEDSNKATSDTEEEPEEESEEESLTYAIYDEKGVMGDLTVLKNFFPEAQWKTVDSEKDVLESVESDQVEEGFVIHSTTKYEHIVLNKDFNGIDLSVFDEVMKEVYRQEYCAKNNLNYEEISDLVHINIENEEQVLGKDMSDSFGYCYILVIAVFMIIIIYGVMIATSVTNEKSNRSIEVLVTSTTPNSLIFGKVIAGAMASIFQVGMILLAAVGGYSLNRDSWGGMLDSVLNIPTDVLIVFALFAIFGFVFYAFTYAAVGALVSKTEDINKSASSVQMIIMIVYFVVLFQMSNIDGIAMKVLSFLPVSSYSAMYIRVAMGEVATWEIILSFGILIVSTVLVGYLAAKIYRMGTLRYGNPISIRSAIKSIRNKSAE